MVTEVASLIFKADTSQMSNADKVLAKVAGTGKRTEESAKKLSAQIKRMEAEYKRNAAAVDLNENQLILYDAAVKGATKEELKQIAAIQRKNLALQKSGKNFTIAKNATQQLGFQVQDIAVQLGAGQSPFVVLSQQGSQLASILGPGGALLGAVIAIGGAIGGALIPNLFRASESTSDYIDRVEELTDGFKSVTAAQAAYINQLKEVERSAAESKIETIKTKIVEMETAVKGLAELMPSALNADEVAIFTEESESAANAVVKLKAELDTERQALEKLQNFLDVINGKRKTGRDEIGRLIASLREEADTYGKTALEVDLYKASLLGASQVEKDQIAQYHARIQQRKDEAEAIKLQREEIQRQAKAEADFLDQQKRERDRAAAVINRYTLSVLTGEERIRESYNRQAADVRKAMATNVALTQEGSQLLIDIERRKAEEIQQIRENEAKKQAQLNANRLNQTADFLSQLAAISSTENKKSFKRSQNLAIAAATIKGVQSTINAYEEGSRTSIYLGAAYAAIAAATTGAQIAQIRNQQPPRQQGGQMLSGRPYLVGENGPEIVSVGGSGGFVSQLPEQAAPQVNISVNNVNNAPGVVSNARVDQVNDRDFIVQVLTEEMTDSTSRTRRGLHSTSNLVARA